MLEPGFYPHSPEAVELRETHISWVFLAGELVYKVKKPLTLPFLDYGTPARRREMCQEEVRLNRRFAPQVYLRVVGIARASDGWALTAAEAPAAEEYAVEMRRFDEGRSMAALAAEGALERRHVVGVARLLARLHAEAPIAPPERSDVEALVATLEENLETLRATGTAVLGDAQLEAGERFTRGFLAARRAELSQRGSDGLVRDCHGDLRAEHVIVPERGEAYAYDCIEFNPSLRQIDVAADIAFLVMDLVALGAEDHALALVDAYREAGGDPGDDALLSFLAAYRAWVRAKVDCLRALELDEGGEERVGREARARERFRLGRRLAWRARRPLVVVVCGVAATGKTTVAREVAGVSGWRHISSDLTRKRLAGLAPQEPAAAEHYSPEFTARTYRELGATARAELDRSGGAIVDATCHLRDERDALRAGMGDCRASLLFVECRAPEQVLIARLRERWAEPGRVSDADAEVVRRQLAEAEPLTEVPPAARAELATEAEPEELAARLEALVDERLWPPGG
jgi:uncharacterized protein